MARSNIVIRDLEPNNRLVGVCITYQSVRGMYKLNIFGTTKTRIQIPDSERSTIEKISIRGNQAYIIIGDRNQQLIWIEVDAGGKALQYQISGNDFRRDLVLDIAESMI